MAMGRRNFRDTRGPQIRVNHRIRVPEVRVVMDDGTMLGVLSTQEALRKAEERGLDLVEVNPKSNPPVCKILDYGKFKYEEKKRQSEAKKKQTIVELKEVKLRPKTDDHDLNFKLRAARRFIESGNKVKFTVRFRGREITHPEVARKQLDWLVDNVTDISNIEQRAQMEGRTMSMIIAPKPQVLHKIQNEKAAAAKKREDELPEGEEHAEEHDGEELDSGSDSEETSSPEAADEASA